MDWCYIKNLRNWDLSNFDPILDKSDVIAESYSAEDKACGYQIL